MQEFCKTEMRLILFKEIAGVIFLKNGLISPYARHRPSQKEKIAKKIFPF